ncbi:hypothetical protein FB451DRAFT_490582 [Mycena latifolia]|nr:hypothetical protein FB451DRAFT_490582 [Mycena latifolia]
MADYHSLFASLQLKHLYASLHPFFDAFPTSHSFFSQITHFELFDSMEEIDIGSWSRLSLIPQLTHLAFTDGALISTSCSSLLEACSLLSILVYIERWDRDSYGSYAVSRKMSGSWPCAPIINSETGRWASAPAWITGVTLKGSLRHGDRGRLMVSVHLVDLTRLHSLSASQ